MLGEPLPGDLRRDRWGHAIRAETGWWGGVYQCVLRTYAVVPVEAGGTPATAKILAVVINPKRGLDAVPDHEVVRYNPSTRNDRYRWSARP